MTKRIVVLGAGISGVGAAVLAKQKGFDVFVSDKGAITDENKVVLLNNEIEWEEQKHTLEYILNADEVIKSPGISDGLTLIQQLITKKIPFISRSLDKKIGEYSYPIYLTHWQTGFVSSMLLFGEPIRGRDINGVICFLFINLY